MSTIHKSTDADIGNIFEKNNTSVVNLTAQECFAKHLRIHSGTANVNIPDGNLLQAELTARSTGHTTWIVHVFCDGNTTSSLGGGANITIIGSTQIIADNQATWVFRRTAPDTFTVHNRPF